MLSTTCWKAGTGVLLLLASCTRTTGDPNCLAGELGCACGPQSSCAGDLECLSGLCVGKNERDEAVVGRRADGSVARPPMSSDEPAQGPARGASGAGAMDAGIDSRARDAGMDATLRDGGQGFCSADAGCDAGQSPCLADAACDAGERPCLADAACDAGDPKQDAGPSCEPAAEVCDGLDNDCDTVPDGDEDLTRQCGVSAVGACRFGMQRCLDDGSWTACDAVEPAAELCDGVDNDCDSKTDEGVQRVYYADRDGDGQGDGASPVMGCDPPQDAVDTKGDCDDSDARAHQGQTAFFTDARTDGSWDFDCDGETTTQYPPTWSCSGKCSAGWYEEFVGVPAPACGQQGYWADSCDTVIIEDPKCPMRHCGSFCQPAGATGRTQACR